MEVYWAPEVIWLTPAKYWRLEFQAINTEIIGLEVIFQLHILVQMTQSLKPIIQPVAKEIYTIIEGYLVF